MLAFCVPRQALGIDYQPKTVPHIYSYSLLQFWTNYKISYEGLWMTWTDRDVWGLMILCTYLWDFGQRLFADTFHIYCQGNSKVFATSRAHHAAQYQDKSNWCNKIFLHRNHRNVTFYLMVASLMKAELMLMPMLIE